MTLTIPCKKDPLIQVAPMFSKNKEEDIVTNCIADLKSQNTKKECIRALIIGNHSLSILPKYSGLGRVKTLIW
jgi:hypothetical protein